MALLFTNFSTAKAEIDWTELTPQPCWANTKASNCGNSESDNWTGPFELIDTIGTCRYTIIYYERMTYCHDERYYRYDPCVTGIFYEGNGCTGINRRELLHSFYFKLIQKKNVDNPNFLDLLRTTTLDFITQHLNLRGKCFNPQNPEQECIDDYCCYVGYDYRITYNTPNKLDSVVPRVNYDFANSADTCTTTCKPNCYSGLLFEKHPSNPQKMGCYDCEWGDITTETKTYFDPNCQCMWEYTYTYRYNPHCYPSSSPWHDFNLENIRILSGTNCQPISWSNPPNPCNTNYDLIYQAILNEMLAKSSLARDMEVDTCILNVRASTSGCKKWQDALGLPPRKEIAPCGSDTLCCLSYFQVCKNNSNQITTQFIGTNNIDNCADYKYLHIMHYSYPGDSLPCFSMCPTYPAQINYNDSKGLKSLFSNDELISELEKANISDSENNYLIQFFDYNGALKSSQNIDKNKLSQMNFTNQFNQKGWIPFIIQNGTKYIMSGYLDLGD